MNPYPEISDTLGMLAACNWAPVTFGRRVVHGEAAWRALVMGCPPPCPKERLGIARALRRHLLCVTHVGRGRLRAWLGAQRRHGVAIESTAARRERLVESAPYFGDSELLPVVVNVIAGLPRPVADYITDHCMIISGGCSSAGWTLNAYLPRRLPIFIAGHRSAEEIGRTLAHEISHRWLLADNDHEARTTGAAAAAVSSLVADLDEVGHRAGYENAGRRLVRAVLELGEREADWLAWGLTS